MRFPDRKVSRPARGQRYLMALVVVAAVALVAVAVSAAAPAGSADLTISKSDNPDPVSVGALLTYTIQVHDLGPDTATGVIVTDQLPKGVDFVSATTSSGPCTRKGRNVSCVLGTIGLPGVDYSGPRAVTLTVIPRKPGTIANTATVKGAQKDPLVANNKATLTTTVIGPVATCRGVPATVSGTNGNDTLVGSGGPDVIAGLGGDDTIVSLAGRDLICAGGGNDYVGAGSAADRVFGAAGRDRLLGRGGPDVLKGSNGSDVLKGNRGADRLRGGAGFDRCRGGAGRDSIRGCER